MRDLEELIVPASGIAFYASGWITAHTVVPAGARAYVSVGLVAIGLVVAVAVARAAGLELEGGRCKARKKTDGARCSLDRDAGEDLCHVHQRTHDVTIHPSAIDGTVDSGSTVDEEPS